MSEELLRSALKEIECTLNIRTRKLVSGPKRYFRIRGAVYPHTVASQIVKRYFPDSYLTSGSMGGGTGQADLTYAEK